MFAGRDIEHVLDQPHRRVMRQQGDGELHSRYSIILDSVSEIVECFSRLVRDDPRRPLIVLPTRDEALTAEDISRQCRESVRSLSALGLGRGDLLVCAIGNRSELVPLLLASRVLDLTVMAVDESATPPNIETLCGRFGAKACLASAPVEHDATDAIAFGPGLVLARCSGEATAYPGVAVLKLTSGSIGPARAARTTESQLIADGRQITATMGIGRDDRQLVAIPLAHSYGLGVIVMPLLLQGTPIVLRDSRVPLHITRDARRFEARCLPGVPFLFEHLVEHAADAEWPRELRLLISAGARLSTVTQRAFHARFGLKIHTFYGTTETGGIAYDDREPIDDASTVGRPLAGVSISLRGEDGLPPGTGRVHVRSAAVSDRYVGDDSDDFDDQGFLTGDYGRLDDEGRLTLAGRLSSFINVAGRKVQPDDVEAVLREHPAVLDVRVLAADDGQRGQQVVACVAPRAGFAAPTLVGLRQFCSTRMAAHKIPRRLVVVDAIPVTARGKTDRAALTALVQGGCD
jgi:long-chain acyl-CoA synthetase